MITPKRRWMANMITSTEDTRFRFPWERGLRREAMIARRYRQLSRLPRRAGERMSA